MSRENLREFFVWLSSLTFIDNEEYRRKQLVMGLAGATGLVILILDLGLMFIMSRIDPGWADEPTRAACTLIGSMAATAAWVGLLIFFFGRLFMGKHTDKHTHVQ